MASGGGGCSASERLPPPFPGMDPESEGAAGGSEPEAGDSDTEGEDIFTGAAAAVSSHLWGSKQESSLQKRSKAHQWFEGSEDGGPGGQSSSGVSGQDSRALKEKRTLEPGCPCRGGKRG